VRWPQAKADNESESTVYELLHGSGLAKITERGSHANDYSARRIPLALCDTYPMQSPLQSPTAATDPKSVKVNLTGGTGMDIEWNDGHVSHYSFVYLRDACPCAMCEEERGKAGRRPGDPATAAPGALLIFKPTAKPLSAEGVGKYAIKFSWNDNHDLGIYSWKFLREICPCEACKGSRAIG